MKRKKLNRKQKNNILSVVPVTSRQTTGTTAQQRNLRGMMKQRVKVLELRRFRDLQETMRLKDAINALSKRRANG